MDWLAKSCSSSKSFFRFWLCFFFLCEASKAAFRFLELELSELEISFWISKGRFCKRGDFLTGDEGEGVFEDLARLALDDGTGETNSNNSKR